MILPRLNSDHLASIAAALAFACTPITGGQTGDLTGHSEPTPIMDAQLVACTSDSSLLSDLESETELGFAPTDVLAFAIAEFTSTLRWGQDGQDSQVPLDANVTPASGTTDLTMTIRYDGGEARYITATPVTASEGADAADLCPDFIELDGTVTLETEDEALNETFPVTLTAMNALTAHLRAELDLANLQGTLAVRTPRGGELRPLVVDALLSEWGSQGTLVTGIETMQERLEPVGSGVTADGGLASVEYSFIPVGAWPADFICGGYDFSGLSIPTETMIDGASAEAVADFIATSDPATVTWDDGTATQLQLDASVGEEVCLDASGAISYPMSVRFTTDDGRLAQRFAMKLSATRGSDAAIVAVNGSAWLSGVDAVANAGFEAARGYDDATISLYLELTQGAEPMGAINVLGHETGECGTDDVTDARPPEESANSCSGSTPVTLLSGAWGRDQAL